MAKALFSFLILNIIGMCTCTVFATSTASTDSNERPEINYPGTLIERSAREEPIRVINIAIGRVQETAKIIAYEKPADPSIKPQNLIVELNLRDIATITVPQVESLMFDKRAYTEIIVSYRPVLSSRQSAPKDKHLIIEETTFLFCDTDEQRPMTKRVLMKAIKKLTLDEGQIPAQRVRDIRISPNERERKRSHACTEVADRLQSLHEESSNMPHPQRTKVVGIVDQIKNWLSELCS